MTLTDLISELETLDAKATRGPWMWGGVHSDDGGPDKEGNFSFCAEGLYGGEIHSSYAGLPCVPEYDPVLWASKTEEEYEIHGECDAVRLITFLGTHRAAILAHLKRLAELESK